MIRLPAVRGVILAWSVEPLEVTRVESSFFSDPSLFPAGAVDFDCALLMRRIPHEWHAHPQLKGREGSH